MARLRSGRANVTKLAFERARPYADVNYEDSVRHAINAKDPNLADRVVLSVLHERRYPPGF